MYYCTFTCYQWISLFELTCSYDLVYKWFNYLRQKKIADTVAYVIMPNHLHFILYFANAGFNLNKVISNAKRFMAYEIVQRLEETARLDILQYLGDEVTIREISKRQKHKVFKESFDAKPIYTEFFLIQKLDYIHHNPVAGKWHLVDDYTKYEHSSASFYECGIVKNFEPIHYRDL